MTDGHRCTVADDKPPDRRNDIIFDSRIHLDHPISYDILRKDQQDIIKHAERIHQNSADEERRSSPKIPREIGKRRSSSYERTAGIYFGEIAHDSLGSDRKDPSRISKKKDEELCQKYRDPNMVVSEESHRVGNADGSASVLACEETVINEAKPIKTSAADGRASGQTKDSPELIRRMSRTDTVRQDVRKLKSVTLDRMGKMFKPRATPIATDKPLDLTSASNSQKPICEADNYGAEPSRKEKTNSLGRMLKLVDKDGAPKKLFAHSRTGSLSRIFRRNSSKDEDKSRSSGKSKEDHARGILSRMLGQLRNRTVNNPVAEPNFSGNVTKLNTSLPPKGPSPSRIFGTSSGSSGSSSASTTSPGQRPVPRPSSVEYHA